MDLKLAGEVQQGERIKIGGGPGHENSSNSATSQRGALLKRIAVAAGIAFASVSGRVRIIAQ